MPGAAGESAGLTRVISAASCGRRDTTSNMPATPNAGLDDALEILASTARGGVTVVVGEHDRHRADII